MLTTDACLDVRTGLPCLGDRHAHDLADTVLVQGGKGVRRQDSVSEVTHQEPGFGIVPAHCKRRLREVVGTERQELGVLGDLISGECGAGDLDHRAKLVPDLHALLFHHLLGFGFEHCALPPKLVHVAGQRDHDLGDRLAALAGHLAGRLEDRPHLHPRELGNQDAEAHAAQAQHRVRLAKRSNSIEHRLCFQ